MKLWRASTFDGSTLNFSNSAWALYLLLVHDDQMTRNNYDRAELKMILSSLTCSVAIELLYLCPVNNVQRWTKIV